MFYLSESNLVEIPFKTTYTTNICRQACPTDFFENLIDKFSLLHHIQEAGESPRVYPQNTVTDDVVGYTRKLHDNDTHILHPLRNFNIQQLLYRHMPAHVVYRSRAVIQTVCLRRNLIERTTLSDLLERPMDITDSGDTAYNTFPIYLHHILKYAMRSRVGRSYIEGYQFFLRVIIIKKWFVRCYFGYRFAHVNRSYRPK